MEQIEVFEEIDASPELVWEVLTAFPSYPEWNPFITSAEGTVADGETVRLRIEPPGGRTRTAEVELVAVEPGHRLAWHGRLLVPFALDGYHEIRVEPIEGGLTRLLQRETFRGALTSLLVDEAALERGFRAMNRALKTRAEGAAMRTESNS